MAYGGARLYLLGRCFPFYNRYYSLREYGNRIAHITISILARLANGKDAIINFRAEKVAIRIPPISRRDHMWSSQQLIYGVSDQLVHFNP